MNRLLYGDEDPKALALDMKEIREECSHCKGYGRIIFFADTGDVVTEEEYKTVDGDREIMMEKCEKCEGTGFINFYIEEPNPIY